ncbi:MAG: zf-HC2 domain-containing protein [Nitrospinales bacterium]
MRSLQKLFKLTCKDTSPLISEMMDHDLPLAKRIKVKFHLAMCRMCQYYFSQLSFLRNMAKEIDHLEPTSCDKQVLSESARKNIQEAMQNQR